MPVLGFWLTTQITGLLWIIMLGSITFTVWNMTTVFLYLSELLH